MGLKTSITGHWKRWIIGGLVAVVVLVVGGPFVYIHFIEGKPLKTLSLADAPTVTSSPSAGAAAVTGNSWKVASGSTVGYRVKEVLFGQSTTAVGRTTDVTGTATIDGSTVSAASFTAQTTTLASDRGGR